MYSKKCPKLGLSNGTTREPSNLSGNSLYSPKGTATQRKTPLTREIETNTKSIC
jgi:hypothetical protein